MRHTIFGEVTEGYDIVEQIENSRTDFSDKPVEKKFIVKATVVEE